MILASESFAGTDANPIGGNWTTITGEGAIQRLSNAAVRSANDSLDHSAYYSSGSQPPDDQYCKLVVATIAYDGGPIVRASTSATTYYLLDCDPSSNGMTLYKVVAGAFTSLGQGTVTINNGDTVELRVTGNTLDAYLNGVFKFSANDSVIASGRFGVRSYGNSSPISFSSFEGGDFNVASELVGQACL